MNQAERLNEIAKLLIELSENWTDQDQAIWEGHGGIAGVGDSIDSLGLNLAYMARHFFIESEVN